MFHPAGFENIRPDGFSVLEVVPNPESPNEPRLFVPLKRTALSGTVAGPLADLHLTQTYGYSHEQCDKTLEALYRFPLPGDATVTGVTVRFGEVSIRAELKERQHAEADYEEAKQQGKQAALATRESPDVFTLSIAGIQPDQEVIIETSYVQLAKQEGSDWTLRIPLTTSPRYVREDEANSRHAHGQPLALMRDPGHRFALDLKLLNAGNVHSPTHTLAFVEEDTEVRVRLRDGEVLPDRDCVLYWRAKQDAKNPALKVCLHADRATNQVYFLALLAPPAQPPAVGLVPREAILLVDHSGSMSGAKWDAADWTVTQFLNGLNPQDTFALGLFHDTAHWFAPKPVTAEANAVANAIAFLQQNKDSGGTNLGVALEQALHQPRSSGERARHTLIVTDAEVSDEGRILRLASEEAKRTDRRRLSVICIDAAPNSLLANEMAERGGGVAKFLTSDPEQEDITTALDTLLEDWNAPILTGLRMEINRPGAEALGKERLNTARNGGSVLDLGDLPAGRAVWIAGRVPHGDSPDLAFRITTEEGKEIAACRLDLDAPDAQNPAIKALFGARRVLALEFLMTAHYSGQALVDQLKRLGYDPDTALVDPKAKPKLYAENVQQDSNAALRGLLVSEALDYGIACSETAFVAVREEAGKRIEETVVVANALPSGWSESFQFSAGGGGAVMRFQSLAMMPMPAAAPPPMQPPSPPASGARSSGPNFLKRTVRYVQALANGKMDSWQPPPTGRARSKSSPLFAAGEDAREQISLFKGMAKFVNGEAILFDTTRSEDAARLPDASVLSKLEIRFQNGAPDPNSLDPELMLLLYVDDLTTPRVRIRLKDLLRQGGNRPLNIRRAAGQVVRLVLANPSGSWEQNTPSLEVFLS